MTDTARNQAITQMQYIEDLLGALRMDWEFLGDLQDHCEEEDLDTLQELTEQAAGCESRDEALERLEENPLEVLYRSDGNLTLLTSPPPSFQSFCAPEDRLSAFVVTWITTVAHLMLM